jgi:hypothetical protein
MYYNMETILKKSETLIEFQGDSKRLYDYFIHDSKDNNFLKYIKLFGIAQCDMKEKDLEICDYLSGMIDIPIFSNHFFDKFSKLLSSDVEFYPLEIRCKNLTKQFYLAKIIRYENWIDFDKSEQREITKGIKLLSHPITPVVLQENFYFLRDSIVKNRWIVSEKFKNLVEENGMKLKFVNAYP